MPPFTLKQLILIHIFFRGNPEDFFIYSLRKHLCYFKDSLSKLAFGEGVILRFFCFMY